MPRPAPESKDAQTVTFRVRRTTLHAVTGLFVGLVIGVLVGRATDSPSDEHRQGATGGPPPPAAPAVADVAVAGRPALGPENAKVTVVEFTDYQCPFCKRYFDQTYRPLLDAYEGRIRYVVRNFPIESIHPFAQKAAEAAECAHDEGKFWKYHDLLFSNQDTLDAGSLKRYAAQVGLDRRRFGRCLDGGVKASVVRKDLEDGRRYGVRGTPTFFINGERLAGAKPLGEFRSAIDAKLR